MSKRIFVVTGANGSLGMRVVNHFSQMGGTVVRIVRTPDDTEAPTYSCDVTNEDSVRDCFSTIASDHGNISALIHTVGTWNMKPTLETSLTSWQSMVDINLTSAFLCFREALRHRADHLSIVGIASQQGADGGAGKQAAYSASKGGLIRLVESIADEYRDKHVNANAIAPYKIAQPGESRGVSADDIASMCGYLCSAEGRSFTGAVLRMYGNSGEQ